MGVPPTDLVSPASFNPADYPRSYRLRLWRRFLVTACNLIVICCYVRIAGIAITKQTDFNNFLLLAAIFLIPTCAILIVNGWRAVFILHFDRIVFTEFLRKKTIQRDEIVGCRKVGQFEDLILTPNGSSKRRRRIGLKLLESDDALRRWFATLNDLDTPPTQRGA